MLVMIYANDLESGFKTITFEMGKHKEKSKKHKSEKRKKEKKKNKKRRYSSSCDSNSTEDEWVEKSDIQSKQDEDVLQNKIESPKKEREEWFSLPTDFLTTSNEDRRKERELNKKLDKERNTYNPGKSTRELNPYWRDGGDGLPSTSFKKPSFEDQKEYKSKSYFSQNRNSNWRRKPSDSETTVKECKTKNSIPDSREETIYTQKDINALAAKLVKAEIIGDEDKITKLKEQLEAARKYVEAGKLDDQQVILTETDSKGYVKPVKLQSDYKYEGKRKKQKVETHSGGERVRYFADDDKYSLQQMFENEKFNSIEEQNSEFLKMAGKIRKNDDMDEVFADNIRKKTSDSEIDRKNKDKAVGEHKRLTENLESCNKCLQSKSMQKNLMISMSTTVYLSVPAHEPLTDGHCLLIPIRHIPCITQIDENEWNDIMDFRKALVKMFAERNEDVIFFETANYLHRHPHTIIQCVPLPKETGDLAPIYFKKAIDESEMEWSTNKKLISLKGRNVIKAVPKGLPYFSVSFGLEEGYAHVIEDHSAFPNNFAQEIIGGMLDLHHSKWRKPRWENYDEQNKRVASFTEMWSKFDFTQ